MHRGVSSGWVENRNRVPTGDEKTEVSLLNITSTEFGTKKALGHDFSPTSTVALAPTTGTFHELPAVVLESQQSSKFDILLRSSLNHFLGGFGGHTCKYRYIHV